MNLFESEILNKLYFEPFVNQRILAESTGCSVGAVNKALRQLTEAGYLDGQTQLTDKGRQEVRGKMPKSAIILAAGFGMRMVPINTSTPKALLEVNGEPLIERTIRQLHEAGVTNITVVVGFMKEQFEYLIDEYGVDQPPFPRLCRRQDRQLLHHSLRHLVRGQPLLPHRALFLVYGQRQDG